MMATDFTVTDGIALTATMSLATEPRKASGQL